MVMVFEHAGKVLCQEEVSPNIQMEEFTALTNRVAEKFGVDKNLIYSYIAFAVPAENSDAIAEAIDRIMGEGLEDPRHTGVGDVQ